MKIELKNIKVLESLSEETNCYTADLWVDGVKTASASNHGHGGCDDYRAYEGQDARLDAAYAWAKTLPAKTSELYKNEDGSAMAFNQDLESIVGDILTEWLIQRDYKKLVKKPTVLMPDGKILQWNCKPTDERLKPIIAAKEAEGAVYLNALPFEQGFAKYRALGA